MMYEQQIKALIAKALAEAKKIEGEVVHVAKADFDALVTRVEALEKELVKVSTSVRTDTVEAAVKVEANVTNFVKDAEADVQKL